MEDWVKYFESTNRTIFNQAIRNKLLIELIIQNTPLGGRILEAGCGTAQLSLLLADYGYDVTALDFDSNVLGYAKRKICLNNVNLSFIQGDITKLSNLFEDKRFNTVCHSGVMEHFSDKDIIKSLEEQRLISDRVIFCIPNHRNKKNSSFFGDERFLNHNQWNDLIKTAGFTKIKTYGGDSFPGWAYLLPAALFVIPRSYWQEKKKRSFMMANKLLAWRRFFSKHFIFICES